jgi:hypothetical protein
MDPQFEYLLGAECLLRPGPTWLFRIASDRLAYEARGLRVRAGERYILVSTAGPVGSREHARPIKIACDGVHGALLDLPTALTSEWEETLRRLCLTQAKLIEVWPAGLAAMVWDGEGHGEWLASERPCLAVRSDHTIGALLVSLESSPELSLELAINPGEPIFIELPSLPIGLHKVSIAALSGGGTVAEPIGDLDVLMRIREARPWSSEVNPQGPLSVDLEPTAPTLEQLWEGRAEISVRGPAERSIKCCISMFESENGRATLVRKLPPISLPLTSEKWRQHFDKHVRESKEAQSTYDDARLCELEFTADELGAFTLRCKREFTPLRWTIRRVGQGYVARMHEDVGSGGALVVSRVSFERPAIIEQLEAVSEYVVPGSGGLYVARLGDFASAIILPATVRRLEDLRCEPRIDDRERSAAALLRIIKFASLWGSARLPGDFVSATRQRAVLRALTLQIFRVLGGDNWGDAEAAAHDRPDKLVSLKRCVSNNREEAALGAALMYEIETMASAKQGTRPLRLSALVGRFVSLPRATTSTFVESARNSGGGGILRRVRSESPDDGSWLAELALRLASDPAHVEAWAGEHLRGGLTRLIELPTLARAARFLVLATHQRLNSRIAAGELYAGWRWS